MNGKVAPPSKRLKTTHDKLDAVLAEITTLNETMKEGFRATSEAANFGPPPATTQDELEQRLREKESHDRLVKTRATLFYDDATCSVCMTREADCLLTPCNHRTCCVSCCNTISTRAAQGQEPAKCPECRAVVSRTLRVSAM